MADTTADTEEDMVEVMEVMADMASVMQFPSIPDITAVVALSEDTVATDTLAKMLQHHQKNSLV